MECFIVSESDINIRSESLILRGDEARHAVRVLRIQEGEQLIATTLSGFCYQVKCVKSGQVSKNEWVCECVIERILPEYNEPAIDIQLIQGITQQQSKLEEIAAKTTEIGISSLIPIFSKRTEKKSINRTRLEKILHSACKQAHRARAPILYDSMNFSVALQKAKDEQRKIILLHESAPNEDTLLKALQNEKNKKITLIIGPEGGFDEAEVLLASAEFGAKVTSLGARRLKAETAAIMLVAVALSIDNKM
jgi:16S rRNA (uracil1498-N3)-methyltransferase